MGLLGRFKVAPLYGQVSLGDPNASNYPQWATGDELVVATPEAVAVASRGDADGTVTIEVWRGLIESQDRQLSPVWDGELRLSGDTAVAGSVVGNDLHAVQLGPGKHVIRVFTSSAGRLPDTVFFLVAD